MPRPSRYTSEAWRSGKRRSAPSTPMWRRASTTWRRCTKAKAAMPRRRGYTCGASGSRKTRSARGTEHPDVASSLGNVAAVYQSQGRYAEAEPLYMRGLKMEEKALGAGHPHVATSLSNLAALYQSQDRYAEALGFSRRSVGMHRNRISAQADRGNGTVAEQRARRGYFLQNIVLLCLSKEPNAAAESFESAQLAGISTAGVAVAAATARLASGGGESAAAIRERQDLAQKWQALDSAIIKAVS